MKKVLTILAAFVATATMAFAHNGNEHVRGVVTAVSPQSITVQTTAKATKTLTISDKTEFKHAGKAAHLADLKVGDRVVVDVPEHSTDALLVQIGAAPAAKATTAKTTTAKK
jgi:hypothetical protein